MRKPDLSVDDALNRSKDCLIITSDHYLPLLREELPDGYEVIAEAPHFMRKGNLVLVGPTKPAELADNKPPIQHWRR